MRPSERNPEIRPAAPSMPLFEQAHARASDPETSKSAARSVVNLGRTRDAILALLKAAGPATDEEIWDRYHVAYPSREAVSPSGLRSRRAELVRMGFVEACGEGKTVSGRACTIWRIK